MKAIEPTRRAARREPVAIDGRRVDEIWAHLKQAEEPLRHAMAQIGIATGDLHFLVSVARYRRDKR